MKLKVLGSYGSTFLNYRSVAFAINDILLIDAGSTSSFSGIGEIAKIHHAAISHAHLDHIKAIPFAGGLSIKAIPVNHTIPASGFLISDNGSTILYSGDTGPTEKLWIQANNTPGLKALMIEVSFPDRLKDLAAKTMHLTPSLMVEELKKVKLTEDVMILPYHFKPPFVDEIRKELSELKMNNLTIIKDGDIFEL